MKNLYLLLIFLLAFSGSQAESFKMIIAKQKAEPAKGEIINNAVWNKVAKYQTFHAPWSNKDDNTVFQCYFSKNYLYFRFIVNDATPTLAENYRDKMDINYEDRAEVFLSSTADMKQYYCAEIDPLGRPMDYSAKYRRNDDFSWSFRSLEIEAKQDATGYIVAGRYSLSELTALGINPKGFYMGVFRADFDTPKKVVWYSLPYVKLKAADFHIPVMLFPAKEK